MMRVLNTSGDCELLSIRSGYLWLLGFGVTSVLITPDSPSLSGRESFDLAVLCYTLSREQKLSLCKIIRQNSPSARIIELYLTASPATANSVEASGFRRMMKVLAACNDDFARRTTLDAQMATA